MHRSIEHLPQQITAVLKIGMHSGRSQLWAPYEHGGHEYRLVITGEEPRSQAPACCNAGDEWIVTPMYSPNGHIVFCKPHRQTKTQKGEHPLIAASKCFAQRRAPIRITHASDVLDGWLEAVDIIGETLRITLTEAAFIDRPQGGRDVIAGFLRKIECPWEQAFFSAEPNGNLTGRCFIDGCDVRIQLWSKHRH